MGPTLGLMYVCMCVYRDKIDEFKRFVGYIWYSTMGSGFGTRSLVRY